MASVVPQFIAKLYKLANAPTEQSYITWNEEGSHFWVFNIESFSRDVLPVYFKHNNYASFVRQLNMYGFHRSTEPKGKVEPGVTLIERFSHPMFILGREDLIGNIHRKSATVTKRIKTEEVENALVPVVTFSRGGPDGSEDIQLALYQLQESITRLEMQNGSLIAQAAQQQEVINHLIHILARNNLLAETDLARQGGSGAAAARDRAPIAPPIKKWDPASPNALQVIVDDDDDFSALLMNTLDMPSLVLDPPLMA